MQLQFIKSLTVFFFYKKLLLLFLFLNTLLLISCSNKIHISEYAKYNRIDHNWYQTFINDSLQFSIDFFGRNKFVPFGNATEYAISKSDIAVLKNLRIRKRAELLLYLKPGIKRYGQANYGYLVDTGLVKIDTSIATFDKTKQGDEFFTLKKIFKRKDETSIVGGTQIKNKYLFLVESQKEAAFEWWNNEGQAGNTIHQLSSILKGENTINYLARRKKLTNAIDRGLYSKNYIKAINGLRAIPKDTIEHYNADNYYYQDLVTRVSYFDNLDSIHESYEEYRSPRTTVNPNNKFGVDGDAIKKVSDIAKTQKMLMINESHYDFRHRLFVYLLLDSLYTFGYRNLCLETLKPGSKFKYISKNEGFYVAEPFYATLVRKAKKIGFNVYGYDVTAANTIPERESGQAKNLYNLYSKDPDHKWVVLAGYSHINKKYFSNESPSALQFFTKLAGFAPFSINQSSLSDITDQRYAVRESGVGYYAVDTSSFIYKDGQADLYVINNIKKHPFEAPFTAIQPYLQKYLIDISRSVNSNKNILVYIKKELEELHDFAIPVYMSMAKKDHPNMLHLPANDYIGIIVDNNGNELEKFKLIREG